MTYRENFHQPTYCIYHQETSHFSSDSEQTTNFAGSQEDKWLIASNSLVTNSGSLHFNFAALPDFIPRWMLCFGVGFSFAIWPFDAFSVIVLTGEHLAIKRRNQKKSRLWKSVTLLLQPKRQIQPSIRTRAKTRINHSRFAFDNQSFLWLLSSAGPRWTIWATTSGTSQICSFWQWLEGVTRYGEIIESWKVNGHELKGIKPPYGCSWLGVKSSLQRSMSHLETLTNKGQFISEGAQPP